ncbi:hypothetical protein L1987_69698 [Smallanthus sonchifolius]|uniref:Uncharacterized protein n=1 Tax=Smallanthus sonchifolius TaxID=185202 RepID=A0ACB9B7C7_9ASTR|nr:hypothetical protein L1987_69698 [Smallanthus sonchifolius]
MLSRANSVIWMDDERENQNIEIEEENPNNWFLQSHNNLLFQNIDPTQVHFFPPPKPAIPSIFNPNNSVDETFDLGYGNGVLPGFCDLEPQSQFGVSNLNPDPQFPASNLLQLAGNGFGSTAYPFLENGFGSTLLKPLDNFGSTEAPPTLFQKRAAFRRNLSGGDGGEGVSGKKRKSGGGSWDDVDDVSFDGSGLNYDSDEFTVNAANFDENGMKISGGNGSVVNSIVTAGGSGGGGGSNQNGKKKGMPAKNLMAERRRRKKLNDRLYMLRSVVPKISKMDRASILGDAIEYLKELLQKINDLNQELEATPSSSSLTPTAAAVATATGFFPLTPTPTCLHSRIKEELCPTAIPSPIGQPATVEVRQREGRAVSIHMFSSRRPGLLLSTTRALDGLGLDVQQAVISCFNGFALDVFRAEQCKQGQDVHPDEVKAVLLECAGYHGVA